MSRLASKPGVQSTLILSKSDGSIIHSTGILDAASSSSSQTLSIGNGTGHDVKPADVVRSGIDYPDNAKNDRISKHAEDIARMVFAFVAGANAFTEGMDESDEVRLLRLRTRKYEIVIVPGTSLHVLIGDHTEMDQQIRSSYTLSYMIHRRPNQVLSLVVLRQGRHALRCNGSLGVNSKVAIVPTVAATSKETWDRSTYLFSSCILLPRYPNAGSKLTRTTKVFIC